MKGRHYSRFWIVFDPETFILGTLGIAFSPPAAGSRGHLGPTRGNLDVCLHILVSRHPRSAPQSSPPSRYRQAMLRYHGNFPWYLGLARAKARHGNRQARAEVPWKSSMVLGPGPGPTSSFRSSLPPSCLPRAPPPPPTPSLFHPPAFQSLPATILSFWLYEPGHTWTPALGASKWWRFLDLFASQHHNNVQFLRICSRQLQKSLRFVKIR